MNVRVRFAPSPTGTLHLGSARSALYNWLYARHLGEQGTYVLRIEDTDRERSTQEAVDQALRIFEWLGLDCDEGPGVGGPHAPYFQSERGDVYQEQAERLLSSGHAYECFCTAEELEAQREAAMAAHQAPIYGGRCRSLSEDDRAALREEGRAPSLRFRVPKDGDTVVDDLILGETRFENALLGDFIIRRSDGMPVYNFAAAVDDADMQITHVIRGNDHLSNTPRQILIYQALGAPLPVFAHVPMILGPDKKKLSKRHGAASVEELAEQGFIPEAVRNCLALLGWSKDDTTTIMTTEEMIEAFDVARVKKSPAAFDEAKLRWVNGQHLRRMSADEFERAYEQWRQRWIGPDHPLHAAAWAIDPKQVALLGQEKVETFAELPQLTAFLAEPFEMTDAAWEKLRALDEAPAVLDAAMDALGAVDQFSVEQLEAVLRGLCDDLGKKPRVVFGPVRFSVTGQTVSPGLFESIHVLGKERTLERMRLARARLQEAGVTA